MAKLQELIKLDPKEFGLEEKKASQIENSFLPKIEERDLLFNQYQVLIAEELTLDLSKRASELRKKLVKIRTGISEIHKVEKAFYRAGGLYVDALKNKHTLPVEQMEEKLSEIENYFVKLEAERKAALKIERIKAFEPYGTDVSFMPLDEMTEEQFEGQLKIAKVAFDAEQERLRIEEENRIAAEKKAEEERVERQRLESERLEAQRLENIRLKEEADKREKELAIERKKLADEQAKKDAETKAEQDRLAKIAADEKAKSDKLAAELKAKQDAEKAKIEAENKRKLELANAGDKVKVKSYFEGIKEIKFPELNTKEGKDIAEKINQAFEDFKNLIINESKKLV